LYRRIVFSFTFLVCLLTLAQTAAAQLTNQGATQVSSGLSVQHGIAYSARHDVYLMVYDDRASGGVKGRFVNSSGATVGNAFVISSTAGIAYANNPMVAYSHDTADDVFFVTYATDRGKQYDGPPSVWIQRVSFTGTGGALVGNAFLASDGVYEVPNDIVYNPFTRKFVVAWGRNFPGDTQFDVELRFFSADGSASGGIVNVSNGNWYQSNARLAVDWETNRIMVAYDGVSPASPSAQQEILGLWGKIVDGNTGALLTGMMTVGSGFLIQAVPVFLPERDGFMVGWTAFTPGRDVQARFVSSATGSVGTMPASVYTLAGTSRNEDQPMGIYDAISRKVLMAFQSSGACPNDGCSNFDGAVLDAMGAVQIGPFTGLSTPTSTSGTYSPDVAIGEGGQFGISMAVGYNANWVQRWTIAAAPTPGPIFGGGGGGASTDVVASPSSLTFSITKNGTAISGFAPQNVSVSFAASPVAWTATTATPWLQIASGSGSGNGQFSVTIINPSDVIGGQTSLNGSVTLSAPGAPNSPVTVPVSLSVTSAGGGGITILPATQVSTGLSVQHGIAYSARHDVYLMVYDDRVSGGVKGRFVNSSGATVGNAFVISSTAGISYANDPKVAYSNDTADDVFFVMYATDRGKQYDGPPSAWIQRVSFTGTGGALVGNAFLASEGSYEIPNDIVYNPVTRKFVAAWGRIYSGDTQADVELRFFNADGTPSGSIVNVSNGNWSQNYARLAVDWETNRIMVAYEGVSPASPSAQQEILGLWAKVVDGSTGALLTGMLTVGSGFTIHAIPVFLPERDGFMVAWTAFTPGRDVQARFVSSATGTVGTMPQGVYTLAGTSRSEDRPMGIYDPISRKVLMAFQSSGGCPNDGCPKFDGAVLDAQGAVQIGPFTGLSLPAATSGTYTPDMAVGEGGQFGISMAVDYNANYVQRVSLPPAGSVGPGFVPETSIALSAGSASFAIQKMGSNISGFSPKTIGVSFTADPLAWTATTSTPWLQVTNGSGSGSGSFSVTIINPGNVIGSQTSLSGSIVVTAAGALNSPVTLPVNLTVASSNLVFLNDDAMGDVLAYHPPTGNWARILTQANGGAIENSGTWIVGSTIKAARFNADALADFFLFSPTTGQWMKILSQGTNFTVQATGSWWPGWQVFPTDLDGDGLTDLFLYDPATGTWFRAISTPTGFSYHQGGWNPDWEISTARLNADTYGDLFLINRTTGRWFWAVGTAGGFTYPVTGTWWPNWEIYPGDFNGDGSTDLLLYSSGVGQYFVATTGASGFTYTSGYWSASWSPIVADLDGDGAEDVFLHHAPTGKWAEMISNKAGGFTNAGGQAWTLGWNVFATDLNGDGRADFVLYNPATGEWVQAKNMTLGSFNYNGGFLTPGLTLVLGLPKG
jgi:hypothetical protein